MRKRIGAYTELISIGPELGANSQDSVQITDT